MKNKLIKLIFSLSSFSGVIMFLLINSGINVPYVKLPFYCWDKLGTEWSLLIKFVLVMVSVVLSARIILWIGKNVLKAEGSISNIIRIKPMEGQFLPVYIGLFVIALSFNSSLTISSWFLIFVLFILWVSFETVSYFNPFFIIWGYRFYEIETSENITSIVITKKKDVKKITEFNNLTRLNNFTFLEY
jgi:hypothetical protein